MHLTRTILTPILFAANLLLALLLIATSYGGRIAPDESTLPSVAAMTFPVWLLLTIICLIINIFLFRKIALLNLLSLICCWGPVLDYAPLNIFHSSDKGKEGDSFTLMTYNVLNLWDFRYADDEDPDKKFSSATLDYIMKVHPDIVALQECSRYEIQTWEKKYPAKGDSLRELYPHRVFGAKDGMSLLSLYPFEEIEIPDLPESSSFYAVCYRIKLEGHDLYLINVHLQSIGLSSNDKALYRELTEGEARTKKMLKEVKRDLLSKLTDAYRKRAVQARALRNFINTLPPDVILCGDFNDIPGSYSVNTILGDDMRSAYREEGFGPGISYHADRFYFRIDHCLYRGDLTPTSCRVIRHPSSDHYPLLTTFKWTD